VIQSQPFFETKRRDKMDYAINSFHPRYSETYNGLPDVFWADSQLTALDRPATLDRLAAVILEHRVENMVGIRLLHSHNHLSSGEHMLESEETDRLGESCLATVATAGGHPAESSAPNSWQWSQGGWVPLEFSVDPLVEADYEWIREKQAFSADFAQALEALRATRLLGLAMIRRKFFARTLQGNTALIETTEPVRRANILRFDDASRYDAKNLIQTVWLASDGDDDSLKSSCIPLCGFKCKILITCKEDNSGGHNKNVDHDREHLSSH
jgi:hypothetical protein